MGEVLLSLVESGNELDRVQRLRLMDVIHEQFVLQRGTKWVKPANSTFDILSIPGMYWRYLESVQSFIQNIIGSW